ncbi:SRPBCC family protein [bacterium]|nr:SRPBCC family protein [bacterium]
MARVEKSINVNVPVTMAYNQWTQFEQFPRFMESVRSVVQLDDRRLTWHARVGNREKYWDAEIQEQVPDRRIVWRSTQGATNAGQVTFQPIDDEHTRLTLRMSYRPEGMLEQAGSAMGMMSRMVANDLSRFRDFVESQPMETGAYRDELPNPNAPGGHTQGNL